ncbi:MAG: D-amino acid dehydrogenase [Sneathiella sp.]
MKIAVLGAGVTGVTTAYYLAKAGHDVTVFDRQPAAAEETSFANGGQISVSQPFPWSSPDLPLKLLKWIGREDAPLVFKMKMDPFLWQWGIRYLLNCRTSTFYANAGKVLALARHSLACQQSLVESESLQYERQKRGILKLFEGDKEASEAADRHQWLTQNGIKQSLLSRAECLHVEPALEATRSSFTGGTWSPEDESGNAREFTRSLAGVAGTLGVEFRYSSKIEGFQADARVITHIVVNGKNEAFDAITLCSGSFSRLLARKAGIHLPIYPVKGYSVSIPVNGSNTAPMTSITDETRHIVISRLGDTLRAAGTAEMNGYQTENNPVREDMVLKSVMDLFPDCGDPSEATRWSGLRPMTTDSVPLIGRAKYNNFYLNTGHGPLGWTLSCGSAELITRAISGKATKLDISSYSVDRF